MIDATKTTRATLAEVPGWRYAVTVECAGNHPLILGVDDAGHTWTVAPDHRFTSDEWEFWTDLTPMGKGFADHIAVHTPGLCFACMRQGPPCP